MLPTLNTNPTATDWRDTLRYGDVVIFRFPIAEEAGDDVVKARPCLILDIEHLGTRCCALVAFGTSKNTSANRGYETRVSHPDEVRQAGVKQRTRFVGARRILVPLDHPGFVVGPAQTPVIGRLTGAAFERMNAVRARICAERDIAAEQRRERRRKRTEPVVVEYRHTRPTLPSRRALAAR